MGQKFSEGNHTVGLTADRPSAKATPAEVREPRGCVPTRPGRLVHGKHRRGGRFNAVLPPPSPRTMHLVDLENLCGEHRKNPGLALPILRRYLAESGWVPGDVVLLSAHRRLITEVVFDDTIRLQAHVAQSGPDGADRTLLRQVTADFIASRFERLVIGSGDHAFAPLAEATADLGCPVAVVARPKSVSWRYWRLRVAIHTFEVQDLVDASGPGERPAFRVRGPEAA